MTKRSHGDGGIDLRSENVYRLRYRVRGQRFTKTFHGTLSDTRKELRALIRSGDTGAHVAPTRLTLADWVAEWLALRQRKVSARTAEHYGELLRVHVLPTLGARPLQQIQETEIDGLYRELARHLSPRSVHHIHVVLNSCLKTAALKRRLPDNPAARADTPVAGESDAWHVLDADQLSALVKGFKGTALYGIVAVAAFKIGRAFV